MIKNGMDTGIINDSDFGTMDINDFKMCLSDAIKKKGLVNNIKSQIRNRLMVEWKRSRGGEVSIDGNSSFSSGKKDLKCIKLINCLIANHFESERYDESLGLFLSESDLSSDEFTIPNLFRTMDIKGERSLLQNLMKNFANGDQKSSLLCFLIKEIFFVGDYIKSNSQQRVDNKKSYESLNEQYEKVDELYSNEYRKIFDYGADKHHNILSNVLPVATEHRLIAYQRYLQNKFSDELHQQMMRFKESEFLKMRTDEKHKLALENEKIRKESLERDSFARRQMFLDQMEALKQKELEIKKLQSDQNRDFKSAEERFMLREDNLKKKEDAVKLMEINCQQKVIEEVERIKLDLADSYQKRLSELESNEKLFKENEKKNESLLEDLNQLKLDINDIKKENELLKENSQTRVGDMNKIKQKDYDLIKADNCTLKTDLNSTKKQLNDALEDISDERKRHGECLRELHGLNRNRSDDQTEIVKLRNQVEQLQTVLENERIVLDRNRIRAELRLQEEMERMKEGFSKEKNLTPEYRLLYGKDSMDDACSRVFENSTNERNLNEGGGGKCSSNLLDDARIRIEHLNAESEKIEMNLNRLLYGMDYQNEIFPKSSPESTNFRKEYIYTKHTSAKILESNVSILPYHPSVKLLDLNSENVDSHVKTVRDKKYANNKLSHLLNVNANNLSDLVAKYSSYSNGDTGHFFHPSDLFLSGVNNSQRSVEDYRTMNIDASYRKFRIPFESYKNSLKLVTSGYGGYGTDNNRIASHIPIDYIGIGYKNTDYINTDYKNTANKNTDYKITDGINPNYKNTDYKNTNYINTDYINTDYKNTDNINTDYINAYHINNDYINHDYKETVKEFKNNNIPLNNNFDNGIFCKRNKDGLISMEHCNVDIMKDSSALTLNSLRNEFNQVRSKYIESSFDPPNRYTGKDLKSDEFFDYNIEKKLSKTLTKSTNLKENNLVDHPSRLNYLSTNSYELFPNNNSNAINKISEHNNSNAKNINSKYKNSNANNITSEHYNFFPIGKNSNKNNELQRNTGDEIRNTGDEIIPSTKFSNTHSKHNNLNSSNKDQYDNKNNNYTIDDNFNKTVFDVNAKEREDNKQKNISEAGEISKLREKDILIESINSDDDDVVNISKRQATEKNPVSEGTMGKINLSKIDGNSFLKTEQTNGDRKIENNFNILSKKNKLDSNDFDKCCTTRHENVLFDSELVQISTDSNIDEKKINNDEKMKYKNEKMKNKDEKMKNKDEEKILDQEKKLSEEKNKFSKLGKNKEIISLDLEKKKEISPVELVKNKNSESTIHPLKDSQNDNITDANYKVNEWLRDKHFTDNYRNQNDPDINNNVSDNKSESEKSLSSKKKLKLNSNSKKNSFPSSSSSSSSSLSYAKRGSDSRELENDTKNVVNEEAEKSGLKSNGEDKKFKTDSNDDESSSSSSSSREEEILSDILKDETPDGNGKEATVKGKMGEMEEIDKRRIKGILNQNNLLDNNQNGSGSDGLIKNSIIQFVPTEVPKIDDKMEKYMQVVLSQSLKTTIDPVRKTVEKKISESVSPTSQSSPSSSEDEIPLEIEEREEKKFSLDDDNDDKPW